MNKKRVNKETESDWNEGKKKCASCVKSNGTSGHEMETFLLEMGKGEAIRPPRLRGAN